MRQLNYGPSVSATSEVILRPIIGKVGRNSSFAGQNSAEKARLAAAAAAAAAVLDRSHCIVDLISISHCQSIAC